LVDSTAIVLVLALALAVIVVAMEEKDTVMTTSATTTSAAAAVAAAAESNKVNGQQDDHMNNKADPNKNDYDYDAAVVNVNVNVSDKKPRLLPPLPPPPPPPKQPLPPLLDEEERLITIQEWIAQPIDKLRDVTTGIFHDPYPASIIIENNTNRNDNNIDDNEDEDDYDNTGILIGNKYHASDIPHLLQLGVTAVLNCASGGIAQLPVEELKQNGIIYGFTNVRQGTLYVDVDVESS
jgi:rhodanese-related sulfurtransferase